MMQRQDCSGLPGQVGLVELLAMDVVEEIQVGLAGEAGVECRGWPADRKFDSAGATAELKPGDSVRPLFFP